MNATKNTTITPAELPETSDSVEVIDRSDLTKKQLQDELRDRGLKLSGNKDALIERLENADQGIIPDEAKGRGWAKKNGQEPKSPKGGKGAKSPKRQKRTPAENLLMGVRDADLSLQDTILIVLKAYGKEDFAQDMEELIEGYEEIKPLAPPAPDNEDDLRALRVKDLKKILKERGYKVGGKKDELIERILRPKEEDLPKPRGKKKVVVEESEEDGSAEFDGAEEDYEGVEEPEAGPDGSEDGDEDDSETEEYVAEASLPPINTASLPPPPAAWAPSDLPLPSLPVASSPVTSPVSPSVPLPSSAPSSAPVSPSLPAVPAVPTTTFPKPGSTSTSPIGLPAIPTLLPPPTLPGLPRSTSPTQSSLLPPTLPTLPMKGN